MKTHQTVDRTQQNNDRSKEGPNQDFTNPKTNPNDSYKDRKNRPGHDDDRKDQVLKKIN